MPVTEPELDVKVAGKAPVAEGVVLLRLVRPDGGPLPVWTPGAHVDLLLGPGLVRQYSLCGDPGDPSVFQVAVLREPGGRGGSAYVHDRLAEGDTIRVRGPRNRFGLAESPRYLFVAGGIGITPILPMVEEAARRGCDWRLVYGGRTRTSMAFADRLVRQHPGRVELCPQDETGLLDLDALLGVPRADTLVYCCGPEPLLAAAQERCASWPKGALRVERFVPAARNGAGTAEGTADGAFEVELALTGTTLTVPEGRSILEVVEEAGVAVLSSCREGTCGTCETAVLGGVPDHRDDLLTEEEREAGDVMFICVSRARSDRLVLEL
ncbi:PDR/VanB family oxidoreductase [Microbispora catharanthi]|uniref:2Fe-2S iron-sulfur cluster binding domain-containing protein n=1 Tax=Microbispora catharanthi TaxID=1712871 RepID=A0A5N6AZM6_9ACTN|nr:PDR/VanB family oxidoreductase [Microbispora catharanthi]KAB8174024.1 2Fe-2S iron-sulfur cluster binding domain-containing protein [Microbispora catharanthi]